MQKSLIQELPEIVRKGREEAQRLLERISSGTYIGLQTNEYVLPSRDSSGMSLNNGNDISTQDQWMNRLIYGDNLLAMCAMLAGDPATNIPSMRGMVDLIYIDPPYDSKADYRTKIVLQGANITQKPTVIEQFGYADLWKDGSVGYLRYLYPRLVLMRELLSNKGCIYVHIDWHIGHYVKVLLDDVFGKENFINEIVWDKGFRGTESKRIYQHSHDTVFLYAKGKDYVWN